MKNEYAEVETDYIKFKSQAINEIKTAEQRITELMVDNKRVLEVVEALKRENKVNCHGKFLVGKGRG